ncbi:MAG: HAD family phosphatase [Cyclobacteriaceae bacterium]
MNVRLADFDTIIFDLGQVIINLEPQKVFERVESLIGHAHPNIPELIEYTDFHLLYEKGMLTTSDFIAACNDMIDAEIPEEDFTDAWNLMVGDIPKQRLDLLSKLKKTHQVLILSNTNEMHEVYFEQRLLDETAGISGFESFVHHPIYSHRIGRRKPDSNIYEYVIDQHLKNPSRALFLDDRPENVAGAKQCGLKSIQVQYPDQIHEILADA